MTDLTHSEMATFAARFSLTPAQAVALPAVFNRAAEMMGWHIRTMIAEATYNNQALGEYLAQAAAEVAVTA